VRAGVVTGIRLRVVISRARTVWNGGDEEGLVGEVAVPDGVHAAVDGVETARAAAPLDLVGGQS